jgi:putative addiction module killer protein
MRKVIRYKTAGGREPYTDYLDSLRDRLTAAKMRSRIRRAGLGNLGDYKPVGNGVLELRMDWGPGFRLYVGLDGDKLIVLMAGDKSTQQRDIMRAHIYLTDYRGNK